MSLTASSPPLSVAQPPRPAPSALSHFIAGNVGGVIGLTLCYPLDTVKVRQQTRPAGTYKGIGDCLTTMTRQEGVRSLYRGLLSPVIGYGLIKSTAFGSYNAAKNQLIQWRSSSSSSSSNASPYRLTLFDLFVCGGFAGLAQTAVRCPVEQIKVIMQARNAKSIGVNGIAATAGSQFLAPYPSTWACVRHVVTTEGIRVGLYRSLLPTLSREIPQYAIYYPTYEIFKSLLGGTGLAGASPASALKPSSVDVHPFKLLIAGGMAGVAQWVPTYALDVVKSRVSAAEPGTYAGLVDCARKLYASEGIGVFGRGLSAAVARAFPLHGCVFLGYEMTMRFLR